MHTSITRRRNRRGRHARESSRGPVFVAQALPASVSGVSKCNLPGYVGFFQFLRNFRQRNAFEQTELILQAALDPAIARRAKQGSLLMF